jgi:hypothetical protein
LKKSAFEKFFLESTFFKDERRETMGRKESGVFFRWFGSFLLLLQNNPKLLVEQSEKFHLTLKRTY